MSNYFSDCSSDQRTIKKAKWQLGSKCPSSYGTLKASITSQILITTGGGVLPKASFYRTIKLRMISCSRDTVDVTYLVVRLDDVVMVEEDPDEVEVVVGTDEVELLKEELESVELELL